MKFLSKDSRYVSICLLVGLCLATVVLGASAVRMAGLLEDLVPKREGWNPSMREDATGEIRRLGTNALPMLLSELRGSAVSPMFPDLSTEERQRRVLLGFRVLGRTASPAIPALENELLHGTNGGYAAAALAAIGIEALPSFSKALTNKAVSVRAAAVGMLGSYAEDSRVERLIPELLVCLRDKDVNLRSLTADTLGHLRLSNELVVSALCERLKEDFSSVVRVQAAQSLGELGGAARGALPALEEASNDTDRRVKEMARWALQKINGP